MISRTISRNPTFASFSIRYRESFGRKFRDAVARTGHYLKPFRKYFFRNFLMVHYFYIITMTILASILLYPIRNEKYIDILFLATGATTQGGLNTVNINQLELYQHIIIYIITFLTTPIAIHSTLAFIRLYWFERHFDGIKDSSKRNYKMRRTKTIIGRELTARTMSRGRQRTGTKQFTSNSRRNDDFQEKLFSGKMVNRDERDSLADLSHEANTVDKINGTNGKNVLDPQRLSWSSSNTVENNGEIHPSGRGLLFMEPKPRRHHNYPMGEGIQRKQPHPESFARRRKSTDISPEDLYRSISMMKGQRQTSTEDDGPALVVAAPGERSDDRNSLADENQKNSRFKKDPSGLFKEDTDQRSSKKSPENGGFLHSKDNDDDDILMENDEQSDNLTTEQNSRNSISSNSSSVTNNEGARKQDRGHPSNSSDSSIRTDSTSDNSAISSNAITTDDRETLDGIDKRSLGDSSNENFQESHNGPSIQFDIAKPPKKEKNENDKTFKKQIRRRNGKGGARIPKRKKIGQRLKRRLSFAPIEKSHGKSKRGFESNNRNTMDNLDDYFADDESDREDGHRSQDETSDQFSRANTFDQQHSMQDENYSNVLGRSQSFDVGKTRDLDQLSTSPEFQRMIYENWKRKNRNRKSILRPKTRNTSISSPNISGLRRFYSNPEGDEEENAFENSSINSTRPEQANIDINDGERDRGDFVASNNSIDEEEGYLGNDINFVDDPSRNRLSRTFSTNYLSWEPTVGRNSIFVGMSKEQKEELGGVEYRAIKLLCRILVCYYGGFWIMAFIFLVPWIVNRDRYREIVRSDGVAPAWWGFFTGMSAFADLGLTLTPDSMMSFQTTSYPTIIMMWFIVIGNTGFPVLLRFIIWILFQLAPDLSLTRESLGFLLDHPRRCFTMLFPSAATWWLVVTLVGLNAIDLIIFVILDLGDSILHHLNRGYRVLVGLFQAISTRTAGFQIVNIGDLHPAVQVSYMLMMYVSVMPLAISIRRTNVYEEQSLGVYGNPNEDADEDWDETYSDEEVDDSSGSSPSPPPKKKKRSATSFIGAHLRRQLSFDLWFMFLGLFIICLAEGGKIRDPRRPEFGIFAILFEIVSAYGTVGLSLGYPNTDTSFSGQFTTLSKLIIIALLIRGRHRGLPYSLDRAIMLPSDRLDNIDKLQDIQMRRRAQREVSADPVTAYFRSKINAIKNGFRKIRKGTIESEEILLDDVENLPHIASNIATGETNEVIPEHHASQHENRSGVPYNYHSNRYNAEDMTGENVFNIHGEPKEASNSPNESSSQPQEPKSYFPETTSSPTQESFEHSPSDPLSGIPAQQTPQSHVAPSLESYQIRPRNSTHSN